MCEHCRTCHTGAVTTDKCRSPKSCSRYDFCTTEKVKFLGSAETKQVKMTCITRHALQVMLELAQRQRRQRRSEFSTIFCAVLSRAQVIFVLIVSFLARLSRGCDGSTKLGPHQALQSKRAQNVSSLEHTKYRLRIFVSGLRTQMQLHIVLEDQIQLHKCMLTTMHARGCDHAWTLTVRSTPVPMQLWPRTRQQNCIRPLFQRTTFVCPSLQLLKTLSAI